MSSTLPIAVCINTLDAEPHIGPCIESVQAWAAQVIVGDMGSTDDTIEVAKSRGARVVEIPPAGIVEPGRRPLLAHAEQPWTFVLDADERAPDTLYSFLEAWTARGDLSGVYLARRNLYFGRWLCHSGFWPDYQMRLFRTGSVTWPPFVHAPPQVDGRTIHGPAVPAAAIVHFNYATVQEWVTRNNRYTSFEVDRRNPTPPGGHLLSVLVSPARYFWRHYIREGGFRDGRQGLWVALLMSIYGELVALKRWERAVAARDRAQASNQPRRNR